MLAARADIVPATSHTEELKLPSTTLAGEAGAPVALEGAPFTEPFSIAEFVLLGASECLAHRAGDPWGETLQRLCADLIYPRFWMDLSCEKTLGRVDISDPCEA